MSFQSIHNYVSACYGEHEHSTSKKSNYTHSFSCKEIEIESKGIITREWYICMSECDVYQQHQNKIQANIWIFFPSTLTDHIWHVTWQKLNINSFQCNISHVHSRFATETVSTFLYSISHCNTIWNIMMPYVCAFNT